MQLNKVAIYCRLSKEDGNEESQSILSQKQILTEYVKKQNWTIYDYYIDDGYSGTNFDRPDFKRLLQDIENGLINIVITKDLSRLGRNYIQTGYYTEEYFLEKNVRYIALNDDYDTGLEQANDFAPFKNIINEWYAKDISKKIRFTLDNKAKRGEHKNTVFPIFGYAYNNLYERVPDSDTAPIVQLIFKKYIEFNSSVKVASFLKQKGIKTPRYYNAIKYGYNKNKVLNMTKEQLCNWRADSIRDIIEKEEYLGVYKTAKSKSVSYKNKKRIKNKDCYVFLNKYPPIIDKQTWETANKIRARTRSGKISVEQNSFKGLIYCANCNSLMRFERRKLKNNKTLQRYYCSNKKCKFPNSIPKQCLNKILNYELQDLKTVILSKENEFVKFANSCEHSGRILDFKKSSLNTMLKRNEEINLLIENLLEQHAKGILPNSTFNAIIKKYSKEKELIEEILTFKSNVTNTSSSENVGNNLLAIFKSIDQVTPFMLQKLIKKIVVKSNKINNSNKFKQYLITITYYSCNQSLKVFKNE